MRPRSREAVSIPATIEVDVSPERLRRFFSKEEGRYRIKRDLRERVLFSTHNLIMDAPFSRLDLVTCRNLLIYLKREAQERVLDLFHFALHPGGLLFLGSAESVATGHTLFAPLDKLHRLFVRRSTPRAAWQLPALIVAAPAALSLSSPFLPTVFSTSIPEETAPPSSSSPSTHRASLATCT